MTKRPLCRTPAAVNTAIDRLLDAAGAARSANTIDTTYVEHFAGANDLASGTRPDSHDAQVQVQVQVQP